MNYQNVKKALDFRIGVKWLNHDARDDFYPDPIRYEDLNIFVDEYIARREHQLLNFRQQPPEHFHVPKGGYLIREAISLKPQARILYLALLHKLLPYFNPSLSPTVYSYRLPPTKNLEAGEYPFENGVGQWQEFVNDFRNACLQQNTKYAIITDLTSFYDHICIDNFRQTLLSLLPNGQQNDIKVCFDALIEFLDSCTSTGYGIPQNYDPSSFFCSAYLTPLDERMQREGIRMFRYVDDIRIVAGSLGAARDALHKLQVACRSQGFFINAAKTKVYERGSKELNELLDIADDKLLSDYDDLLRAGDKTAITAHLPEMMKRLEHHAQPHGDERKFRAFSNKLLDTAKYVELRNEILPTLQDHAMTRLRSHPEKSDTWARLLSPKVDKRVQESICALLHDGDYQSLTWQRLWLLETLLRANSLDHGQCMDEARRISTTETCSVVQGRALLIRGRFGDNTERETIASDFYKNAASIDIKRAVVLAIQEMPQDKRDSHYNRFLKIDPDTAELIKFVQKLERPRYCTYSFEDRHFPEQPKKLTLLAERGIGLMDSKVTRFRLSTSDIGYE